MEDNEYNREQYLIEIDYKTWKKIVEEQIEHLRKRLVYYLTRLDEAEKLLKEEQGVWYRKRVYDYFKKRAMQTLDELIMTEDMYYYVSANKDEYRYFIDFSGTIYVVLYTPTTRKLFERKTPYIL
jgi:hypothetical protein